MKALVWKPGLNDGSQGEMPHIGMGIVADEFRRWGYNVTMIDEHFMPIHPQELKQYVFTSDWLVCSLVSLEWNLPKTQAIIDLAAKHGKKIIIGGPHAQGYWELMKDDKRLTKIVIGEIDGRLPEVLLNKDKVIKIGHARELSTPDYTKMLNKRKIVAYPIYLSRGCTNLCSFCAAGRIHGRYRTRDICDAIEELRNVPKLYPNVKRVYIVDDAFTGDMLHAKQFLREYKRLGFSYHLQAINVRADQVDGEFLALLKSCGADMLPVGVESADPTVFKAIGKGETLDQIRQGILEIQKSSLVPWLNMIIGLPQDTPERHANSMRWCMDIPEPKIVHWFQFAPFRGTKAFDYFYRMGVIPNDFIPSPYGRRYDDLPWTPDFDAPDFTIWQKTVAQLEAYLKCGSPVPIVSKKAKKIAWEASMEHLWLEWRQKNDAKIQAYLKNYVPDKKKRGQL